VALSVSISSPDAKTTNGAPDDPNQAAAISAIDRVSESSRKEVAMHAARTVPDRQKAEVAAAAVLSAPDANKASVASAAVNAVPDSNKVDAISAALRAAPSSVGDELIDRLMPDQAVTNKIWLSIVSTFAVVLVVVMLALIGAIFVGFWRKTDAAMIQILLTVFTTSAGILAGFISGRASTSGTRRSRM
jgi:hypothetical protein